MSVTAQQMIDDALTEIGVLADGETARAPMAQRALRILNRDIVEPWNSTAYFATHRLIVTGTFTASQTTRTIGPGGNFPVTPMRPDELLQAHWVDTNGQRVPIEVRSPDWYAALEDPTRTGSRVTDVAYFATPLLGTMYPWPVPEANVSVEIETLSYLERFPDLITPVDLANGYESAVVYTLSERCCKPFGRPIPDELPEHARRARDVVRSLHMKAKRISTIPY